VISTRDYGPDEIDDCIGARTVAKAASDAGLFRIFAGEMQIGDQVDATQLANPLHILGAPSNGVNFPVVSQDASCPLWPGKAQ
jgi:hypothetical protein